MASVARPAREGGGKLPRIRPAVPLIYEKKASSTKQQSVRSAQEDVSRRPSSSFVDVRATAEESSHLPNRSEASIITNDSDAGPLSKSDSVPDQLAGSLAQMSIDELVFNKFTDNHLPTPSDHSRTLSISGILTPAINPEATQPKSNKQHIVGHDKSRLNMKNSSETLSLNTDRVAECVNSPDPSSENGRSASSYDPRASVMPTQQTTPATQHTPNGFDDLLPKQENSLVNNGNSSVHGHEGSLAGPSYPPTQYPMGAYPQQQHFYTHPQNHHSHQPAAGFYDTQPPVQPSLDPFSPSYSAPNITSGQFALLGQIFSSFDSIRFSDTILCISHEEDRFPQLMFNLHKVIIARSSTLLNLIDEYAENYDEDGKLVINLRVTGDFVTPSSLEAALRSCYGEPVTNFFGRPAQDYMEGSKEGALGIMKECLGFANAGQILKLQDVELRGLGMAAICMDWANLDHAMKFASDQGKHPTQTAEGLSASFSEDFQSYIAMSERSQVPTFPHNAYELLFIGLRFILCRCPLSWRLDKAAKPLPLLDRLPFVPESGETASKSRLSQIKFGQLSPEEDADADMVNTLLSSFVLSLPFEVLTVLLRLDASHGGPISAQLTQIVEERERRREQVLGSDHVDWNQRRLAKDSEWFHVGFVEMVVEDSLGGSILSREKCSIYRTSSDQALAEERDEVGKGIRRISQD